MTGRIVLQVLVLLGVALGAAVLTNRARSSLEWRGGDPELLRYEVEGISPQTAAGHLDEVSVLFLDVRSETDYQAGHVRGAVPFSFDGLEFHYQELRDFLDPEMLLIVYGDETIPAVRAAEFLTARGYETRVLEGGFSAWTTRALPIDTETR